MMKIISKTICLSSVFSLVIPVASFALINSAYASLVDTSQNQTFESRPTHSFKIAAVHFITNDNALNFGNQEFLPGDLCKQGGYSHEGCPSGYIKGEACPYDSKFVKDCIDPDTWCKNNGYNVTSCSVPKYPANPCPYKSSLYKSCEVDNIRACKEAGYSLTCEAGKVGGDSCPYNSSYKTCVCNPCSGYDYTAAQASAQGYVPGEVCNSCGTMKYKRSENACSGYKTCDCGSEVGAKVCYSGSVQKFDTCKTCCDSKYQYDSTNCTGGKVLAGSSCGGKYDTCQAQGLILYSDRTTSYELVAGKTPIGVVFDETNRIAAAINNIGVIQSTLDACYEINKDSTLSKDELYLYCGFYASAGNKEWGKMEQELTYQLDIPDLENCNECDSTCAPDGKENTRKILAFGKANGLTFSAAEYVNNYQPLNGCSSGSWCGKGNWFLSSMRDLNTLFTNKETVKNTLKLIPHAEQIIWDGIRSGYMSSNEKQTYYPDNGIPYGYICSFHMGKGENGYETRVGVVPFSLPIIRY